LPSGAGRAGAAWQHAGRLSAGPRHGDRSRVPEDARIKKPLPPDRRRRGAHGDHAPGGGPVRRVVAVAGGRRLVGGGLVRGLHRAAHVPAAAPAAMAPPGRSRSRARRSRAGPVLRGDEQHVGAGLRAGVHAAGAARTLCTDDAVPHPHRGHGVRRRLAAEGVCRLGAAAGADLGRGLVVARRRSRLRHGDHFGGPPDHDERFCGGAIHGAAPACEPVDRKRASHQPAAHRARSGRGGQPCAHALSGRRQPRSAAAAACLVDQCGHAVAAVQAAAGSAAFGGERQHRPRAAAQQRRARRPARYFPARRRRGAARAAERGSGAAAGAVARRAGSGGGAARAGAAAAGAQGGCAHRPRRPRPAAAHAAQSMW
jgi:hypothetical protein